jgi:hypothetical protein
MWGAQAKISLATNPPGDAELVWPWTKRALERGVWSTLWCLLPPLLSLRRPRHETSLLGGKVEPLNSP